MTDPSALHREAMELADGAAIARREGREAEALLAFAEAHRLEAAAASLFSATDAREPTRSILHRSAASLALDCGDFRSAEKMIAAALVGEPPAEIANELRDLMEMVHFQRHLDLRGIHLDVDEFQFSIEGGGVGFGIAPASQFVGRVLDVETLIYRTAERTLRRPFRESGRRKKTLDESLQLYVSVPRAASFAVTFRLGSSEQLELPDTSLASDVVREVLDCLELVDRGDIDALAARIDDQAYLRNFLGLAQKIAPDGEVVRSVGFTSSSAGAERRVALTVTRSNVVFPRSLAQEPVLSQLPATPQVAVSVEIVGILLEADAKGIEHGRIEIRTEGGKIEVVVVPRGMMRDIVRPHFEEEVIVTGMRRGAEVHLESIRALDG